MGDVAEDGDEDEVPPAPATPATRSSIVADLRALGLERGATVVVHSSLSKVGWVPGGAHAVVHAQLEAVGPDGTIAMPTHSGELSNPALWRNPPVPESWWQPIRDEMPAFDPRLTPTSHMGAIVECFRHVPGVRRSAHPMVSFAAVGPNRDAIVDGHALDGAMGESSPLARLYDLDARVLLLGVGHANNTSLHLAESRAEPDGPWLTNSSPVLVDGESRWVEHTSHDGDESDFEACGAAFAATAPGVAERTGLVGAAASRLLRQRELVDFAVGWFRTNRPDRHRP